jgi:hypothetical protein
MFKQPKVHSANTIEDYTRISPLQIARADIIFRSAPTSPELLMCIYRTEDIVSHFRESFYGFESDQCLLIRNLYIPINKISHTNEENFVFISTF